MSSIAGLRARHIAAHLVQIEISKLSLSCEHLGSVMQKCTPDPHHRMKCDYGDVLGARKFSFGECFMHILIFEQIHELRNSTFAMVRATRAFCEMKKVLFL